MPHRNRRKKTHQHHKKSPAFFSPHVSNETATLRSSTGNGLLSLFKILSFFNLFQKVAGVDFAFNQTNYRFVADWWDSYQNYNLANKLTQNNQCGPAATPISSMPSGFDLIRSEDKCQGIAQLFRGVGEQALSDYERCVWDTIIKPLTDLGEYYCEQKWKDTVSLIVIFSLLVGLPLALIILMCVSSSVSSCLQRRQYEEIQEAQAAAAVPPLTTINPAGDARIPAASAGYAFPHSDEDEEAGLRP